MDWLQLSISLQWKIPFQFCQERLCIWFHLFCVQNWQCWWASVWFEEWMKRQCFLHPSSPVENSGPPGTRCRATIKLCWMKSWLIGLLLMNLPYLPFPFSYCCYNCVCVCTSACVSTHTYIHVSVHTCAYLATVGYVPKFRRVFYQMSSFSKSRPLEDQIWGFYGIFYALWIVY